MIMRIRLWIGKHGIYIFYLNDCGCLLVEIKCFGFA